jgi:hypothetical protein
MDFQYGAGNMQVTGSTDADNFTYTISELSTPNVLINKLDRLDARVYTSGTSSNFKVTPIQGVNQHTIAFQLLSGDVTFDPEGNILRLSESNLSLQMSNGFCAHTINRNLTGYTIIDSWKINSLTKHVDDAIKAMVFGKTPSTAPGGNLFIYTSESGGTAAPNYVRNPNLFTGGLGMEATSCSMDNGVFEAVLISPLHVITSHMFPVAGGNIVFKDSTGTYITRTITSVLPVGVKQFLSDTTFDYSGFAIGKLSAPITTIEPLTIVPENLLSYIPSLHYNSDNMVGIPALSKHHVNGTRMRVARITAASQYANTSIGIFPYGIFSAYPNYSNVNYNAWSSSVTGGDSNSPVFLPINGKAVLLTCQWQLGGSRQFTYMVPEINAVMTALGGIDPATSVPYQVKHPDLSMFNTYP